MLQIFDLKTVSDDGLAPKISGAFFDYVLASNGLFIHARNRYLSACVPISRFRKDLRGLPHLDPFAELLVQRVPENYLAYALDIMRRSMPNECMVQFLVLHEEMPWWTNARWEVSMPSQYQSHAYVTFAQHPLAVIDLHSHHILSAFFSSVDDEDETGLRFYCVAGRLDQARPQLRARVGVFGHWMPVPATLVFDGLGPFVDMYEEETLRGR